MNNNIAFVKSGIPNLKNGIGEIISKQSMALSSSIPAVSLSIIQSVRKMGQNTLAAMFIVALIQALVALIQYRTNPSGQLIIPPGLTFGVVLPEDEEQEGNEKSLSSKIDGSFFEELSSTISKGTSRYANVINRINRFLFLLIPWASRRVAFFWGRNTHLFHLGFILSLNRLFGIPNKWFTRKETFDIPTTAETFSHIKENSLGRLVVIGDSLAVGLGSVDAFDSQKDNSIPFMKIENIENDDGPGPVFPRRLAESLSNQLQVPFHWRSAGVDGGDVKRIDTHCLDVIEEEAATAHPPDIIVILCGINDLKNYVGNPFKNIGPRKFRSRLLGLIQKIKQVAPNAKVVVPSFPTQMFHRKSPLNIFPLNFFLDSVIAYWDHQKKLVADAYPTEIFYFEMNPSEIFEWFEFEDKEHCNDSTLLAADGVHPNAKCYASWANSLGSKIFNKLS